MNNPLPHETCDQSKLIESTPHRNRPTNGQVIAAHATFYLTGVGVMGIPHLTNFPTSYVLFFIWLFLTIYLGMRIVRQWADPLP